MGDRSTRAGPERAAVQAPLVRYAVEAGWTYLPPDEALRLRRGEASAILYDVAVEQLQRLNPDVVDLQRAGEFAARLARVPPTIEGNLQAWEYLNGLKTVFVPEEKRERDVRLLDPANPEVNAFHVTDEFRFTNGVNTIRADVVLLVNGVPVIIVETKSAQKLEGIADALDQVARYHREGPELLAIAQLFALTHLIHFYYGATWSLSRKALFNWRDEQAGDFETLVRSFVAPSRVLRVLHEFILFTRRDGELAKVVLRPHQMRAAERVVQRARHADKRRGLVWHTQGSGKTYTMITVARRLLDDPAFQNPTVLMLVDRNELEAQLFQNLEAVGFGQVTLAQTKQQLRQLLARDHRGLIVSTIHKFDDMPPDASTRENVFVLVDEAHRTTGGDLGNYLMGALPNATYVGFTGTPIDRTAHGKGTFKVFGSEDPRGYLDKYSIRESIEDGTTVPLRYALAPNELLVDRETLERDFLDLAELEGVSEIEEINRVLDRAVTLANMLKNPERMAKIAAHVAAHFRATVEPMGYKAFLVAVDREACARYKALLDRHLPPEYSEVVISAAQNDGPELARHRMSEEREGDVRKAFRKPDESPKILIVTEKLLTGFDAPILYCMYLDKPMRDHVLLQAIARVNRPYEDTNGRRKPCGFVQDYVGIFDKLEKALAFDSEDVKGVVEGLDRIHERFVELMRQGRAVYLAIGAGLHGDKQLEARLDHFRDEEVREQFYQYYRELQETYEILSPDPLLRPYLKDYERLAAMYLAVRAAFDPGIPVDRSFMRKTALLVEEHTRTTGVRDPREVYDLTAEALAKLVRQDDPDTVKVFNLIKALKELVARDAAQNPYLIPIGERAEQIAEAFKNRQIETEEALEEFKRLIQQHLDAQQSREARELTPNAFAVFFLLNRDGVRDAEQCARQIDTAFAGHPHWERSDDQEREVRKAIYKALLPAGVGAVAACADRIFTMLRRER